MSKSERSKELRKGDFDDAYTRNSAAADGQPFWDAMFNAFPCRRVLEVGCNLGANLKWVSTNVAPHELFSELKLLKQGFLSRDDGWEDMTWLFEGSA